MASVGRTPKGDRDKPPIPNVITSSGDGADSPVHIPNVITSAKPESDVPKPIANAITSPKKGG